MTSPGPAAPRIRRIPALLALAAALSGIIGTALTRSMIPNPYAHIQLAASRRMNSALHAVKAYVQEKGIRIEPEDLNQTGLIGPAWTPLTTSMGMLEAKRTSLQSDFAALMVTFYHQAGLKAGDRVACGMSGSFPALGLAAVAAANEMGLEIGLIPSYGSSMYGATRPDLSVVRILKIAAQSGAVSFNLLAVTPGGDFDRGDSVGLFPDSRAQILALARREGVDLIDPESLAASIQERLKRFGRVDCFVNIGGASANMGVLAESLSIPNGLVTDLPRIPQGGDRGLIYEFAVRGIPVIHLLNIRSLAERHGLPVDPVPLPPPGASKVYAQVSYSSWPALTALALSLMLLFLAGKSRRLPGTNPND